MSHTTLPVAATTPPAAVRLLDLTLEDALGDLDPGWSMWTSSQTDQPPSRPRSDRMKSIARRTPHRFWPRRSRMGAGRA